MDKNMSIKKKVLIASNIVVFILLVIYAIILTTEAVDTGTTDLFPYIVGSCLSKQCAFTLASLGVYFLACIAESQKKIADKKTEKSPSESEKA